MDDFDYSKFKEYIDQGGDHALNFFKYGHEKAKDMWSKGKDISKIYFNIGSEKMKDFVSYSSEKAQQMYQYWKNKDFFSWDDNKNYGQNKPKIQEFKSLFMAFAEQGVQTQVNMFEIALEKLFKERVSDYYRVYILPATDDAISEEYFRK